MYRKYLVAPLVVALAACVLFSIPWASAWTNQVGVNPGENRPNSGFFLPNAPRVLSINNDHQDFLTALDKKVAWEFKELPLSELPARIKADLGIHVVIDERMLADASIGTDTLINCPLDERSARAVLQRILPDIGLTFMPGDECLLITTPEEAQLHPQTRIYPVLDLVQAYDDKGNFHDYDTLITAIQSSVQMESWSEYGGSGSIEPFPAAGAVVISQSEEVHHEVERLLTLLRQTRRDQGLRGPYKSTTPAQPAGGFGGAGGGGGGLGNAGVSQPVGGGFF